MSLDGMPEMTPGSMPDNSSTSSQSEMMMMKMHMSFYWGKDAIILFSGWPKDNTAMYLLAFVFVFLLAVAIEVLSVSPTNTMLQGTNPLVGASAHAGVHAVRTAFAYLVMLSVMSYNLGIFIAAVAGHAIGCFIVKARALASASDNQSRSDGDIKV